MYISTLLLRGLVAEIMRRRIEVTALLQGTGLSLEELTDIESHAPLAAFERLARNAVELTGDPAIGLRIGMSAPDNALQVIGHLVLACRTLRGAFAAFVQHAPYVAQGARWELQERGELAYLTYHRPNVGGELARLAADGVIATMSRIGRAFVPDETAHEVWFVHPRPDYEHEYTRLFRAPVRFEQARNALIFRRELLDRTQLHADDTMVRVLHEAASRLLHGSQVGTTADRVRGLLRAHADLGTVSLPEVARKLGTSERTLRTRLAEEAVSFTRLIDEERRVRACQELRKSDACIKVAAQRAGFSERTSFHRAFKRWTGKTPSEYIDERA